MMLDLRFTIKKWIELVKLNTNHSPNFLFFTIIIMTKQTIEKRVKGFGWDGEQISEVIKELQNAQSN